MAIMSGMTLIYGTTMMIMLLDIHIKKLSTWRKLAFYLGILLVILVNTLVPIFVQLDKPGKFYTLTAQIPVLIVLYLVSDYDLVKMVFVTLTAIFLTFPIMLTYVSAIYVFNIKNQFVIFLCCLLSYLICTFLVYRFFKPSFNYMIKNYTNVNVLKFCFVPILYNVSTYALGRYDYSSITRLSNMPIRTLLFVATLSVYLLFLDVFNSSKKINSLQSEYKQLEELLVSADKQLSTLRYTQEQASIYRHDMRHHFALIIECLTNGETNKAIAYIKNAQSDIDTVTPVKYCLNNTVNLILSANLAKATKSGIALNIDANLPHDLSFPQAELCAILSNGLENAITASSEITSAEKIVYVRCNICKNNLLIQIENQYCNEVIMKDGIPQSNVEGHGFGVKSIEMLAKKHGGYCSFLANHGLFILKIALPL